MYQLIKDPTTGELENIVHRLTDNAFIPFDTANTDYQQFKIQVTDGTPLEDANGVLMTQAEVDAFLKTIP